jgi:hypothetical protein
MSTQGIKIAIHEDLVYESPNENNKCSKAHAVLEVQYLRGWPDRDTKLEATFCARGGKAAKRLCGTSSLGQAGTVSLLGATTGCTPEPANVLVNNHRWS